jgi:hypothetical protein
VRAVVAAAELRAGRLARAEALSRENLARGRELANGPAWLAGELESTLARVLIAEHRRADAEALLAHAVPLLDRELGPGNRRARVATAAWHEVRAD